MPPATQERRTSPTTSAPSSDTPPSDNAVIAADARGEQAR
jgi:hypothetical protein